MHIIISSSKTQSIKFDDRYKASTPIYNNISNNINTSLKDLNLLQLKSIYKSSDKIIEKAYKSIQEFSTENSGQAILSYTGSVFSNIQANKFNKTQIEYINNKLVILSAHYGILKPLDLIKPYRLDFKCKTSNINLKSIWQKRINEYFNDEIILNLASKEFSSLITKAMINIEFREKRNDKYLVIGTYSKMARGSMINMIVQKKIEHLDDIKKIIVNGYIYNEQLSTKDTYIYLKSNPGSKK